MAELNRERSEVNARIVYWGPQAAGTSTNLEHVARKLRADHRGALERVPTAVDPTVTYEMLPITLGEIAGTRVRLRVIAVPGGAEHAPTRKQLLDRADGVVLVVDTSPDRIDDNLAAFDELRRTLGAYGRSLEDLPLVVQYNKRDLADELTLEELHRKLDLQGSAMFEAVASEGKGVLPTLTTISKNVIRVLREGGLESMDPVPEPVAPAPAVDPEPEPLPAPEPLPEAEPMEAEPLEPDPIEEGIALEAEDPAAAADVADLAARTEALLDDSWGSVTAPIPTSETALPGAGDDLRIDSIGTPERAGDRGLVVPLVLRDGEGRTFSVRLALTLDLLPPPRDD